VKLGQPVPIEAKNDGGGGDNWSYTVKPVLFACPLFREFRDLGNFAKITGR